MKIGKVRSPRPRRPPLPPRRVGGVLLLWTVAYALVVALAGEMAAYGRGIGDQDILGNLIVHGVVSTMSAPTGDVATDTGTLQQAHNRLSVNGGIILAQAGTYNIAGFNWTKSNVIIAGAGRGVTTFVTSSGDLINLGTSGVPLTQLVMRDLTLQSAAGGGDILAPKMGTGQYVAKCTFERVVFQQDNDTKYIIHGAAEGWIENAWRDCQFQHTLTGSVNPISLIPNSGANVNFNLWDHCRFTFSGTWFVLIDSQTTSTAYDNVFRHCNFEVTRGGNVKILSGWGTVFDVCSSYDFAATPPSQSLYYIGKSAVGTQISRETTFRNVQRRDNNTLGGGVYDIELEGSSHAICTYFENIDQGGAPGNSCLVNLNLNAGCVDRGSRGNAAGTVGPVYSNIPQDFIRILAPATGENLPQLQMGTRVWLTGNNSPETVITAPVGSMYLRTNGGAVTTLYIKESGVGNTGWVAK